MLNDYCLNTEILRLSNVPNMSGVQTSKAAKVSMYKAFWMFIVLNGIKGYGDMT